MQKKQPIAIDEITHDNYLDYEFEEEFKFSANVKFAYFKREFINGQVLYWKYEADGYPLDESEPVSRHAYYAVK